MTVVLRWNILIMDLCGSGTKIKDKIGDFMKKVISILLLLITIFILAACSSKEAPSVDVKPPTMSSSEEASQENEQQSTTSSSEEVSLKNEYQAEETEQVASDESKVLIAYFTMPEELDTDGVDAIAGSSIVVNNGEVMGNTEYITHIIQDTIGGDLFEIKTEQQYPLDHDPLVDLAADEKDNNARPALSTHIENLDQYDTIILGYPNWWADLPMPLYTFLEEYDLSGKTIIPFCPHGGSGFSRTVSTIAEIQPNATVSQDGFTISRNRVADSKDDVTAWLKSLDIFK